MENYAPEGNIENFQFLFTIDNWKKETNKNDKGKMETMITYEIECFSHVSNNKWSINRRESDFTAMFQNLDKICLNLPPKPKLFTDKNSSANVTKNGKLLEKYIQQIMQRGDVYNSQVITEFFNFNNHFDSRSQFTSGIYFTISDIKFDITDFIFDSKFNLFILGCSNKKNMMENFKNMFVKTNTTNTENKGELIIYKFLPGKRDGYKLIYSKQTTQQIYFIKLYYDTSLSKTTLKIYLIVAYINGLIEVYQISEEIQNSNDNILNLVNTYKIPMPSIYNYSKFQIYQGPFPRISIGFNVNSRYLFVTSINDININAYYLIYKEKSSHFAPTGNKILNFNYDNYSSSIYNRYIVQDEKGNFVIGIFNTETLEYSNHFLLKNFEVNCPLFKVDWNKQLIFTSKTEGVFNIYKFNSQKNENDLDIQFSNILKFDLNYHKKGAFMNMFTKQQNLSIKDMFYNAKKKDIYICFKNGLVVVYSHDKDNAEFVIEEIDAPYEKIMTAEDLSFIFCATQDKKVNAIALPKYWLSEMTRNDSPKNSYSLFNLFSPIELKNEIEESDKKVKKISVDQIIQKEE